MTAPLDLRAVEAHLEWPNGAPRDELLALLAVLRETRAALVSQAKATAYYNGHGLAANRPSPNDPTKEIWWEYLTTEARAVLSAVSDA